MFESRIAQALLAAIPLLLVPAFGFALAGGWIDLGGGEKDILFVFPYTFWALVLFLSSVVWIVRGRTLRYWLPRATAVATGMLVTLGVVTFVFSLTSASP